MDKLEAIKEILEKNENTNNYSIGTKKEKTIHKFLKYYICSDSTNHEIKIANYYVDCFYNGMIYEIQTRSFNAFREKISVLLKEHPLTIVYPISYQKQIFNTQDGEIVSTRKSPKKTHPLSICEELYKIKPLLTNPNLHLMIIAMNTNEYRYYRLNRYKQLRTSRIDQTPTEIVNEYKINNLSDLKDLLPKTLPERFTTKDLMKHTKTSKKVVGCIANVLNHLDIITKVDKIGNSFVYEIKK